MTLDEAIKHAEEIAIEKDKLCKRYDDASGYTRSHNEEIRTSDAKNCEKCAAEHRQLAELLKDYKRLLEQEPILDNIRAEIVELPTISFNANDVYKADVLRIIDKYKSIVPTEDVRPVVRGKWIEHQEGRWIYAKCSNCGTVHDTQTNYCPSCGFAMERTDI